MLCWGEGRSDIGHGGRGQFEAEDAVVMGSDGYSSGKDWHTPLPLRTFSLAPL